MRNLSRAEARAVRLFDRARTIAVVGAGADQRSRATTAHLRRGGYDVVPVAGGGVAGIPGAVAGVVAAADARSSTRRR